MSDAKWSQHNEHELFNNYVFRGDDPKPIGMFLDKADTATAIQAVNTYDAREALIRELVAALEAVLERYCQGLRAIGFSPGVLKRSWEIKAAHEALAKAKRQDHI